MSDTTQAKLSVERMRQWREQYRIGLAPSPLEDIGKLTAQLDLTHAHPSGIAQLFASGRATLESLFRDAGMLRAAGRRLERVIDDRVVKERVSGSAELSLVVGVATWTGNAVPVLLYPVDVTRRPGGSEIDATITFTGHVGLNPAFVSALREQGIALDEATLFDGANYGSGTPETSAVFASIVAQAGHAFAGFDIERTIVLACFTDPGSNFLMESQRLIESLSHGATGNAVLDALAGDEQAIAGLKDAPSEDVSPFDSDPHTEFEAGDVDNAVRHAARMAASGHSVFLDAAVGDDTAQQAVAIASRCVMDGKSVLYVPCVAYQKHRFKQAIKSCEMSDIVLDAGDDSAASDIDRQLIAAVGFHPGVAASRFEQLSDELVGVRSRLTRYLGDLHGINEYWGVSAYQTIQNLAGIASLPSHPTTHVRLGKDAAMALSGHMDEWIGKLRRAGELGEYTIGPEDTAWYGASLFDEGEAVGAYQRVVDVLRKLLPLVREQVAVTARTCGFPVPATAQEWGRQVKVLKNLRRVLDVFQPEIFERDVTAMIAATKSKAERKAEGVSMGFWERRRHTKEAKGLLRVGAQVRSLHDALKVVARQAQQWRMFVPNGGWPVLPDRLDDIIQTQEALADNITALDTVLASTPQGGNLGALDIAEVEERLKALYDDHLALNTLPDRCRLEREFHAAGLDELIEDLRHRRIGVEAVEGELLLAWWTTVFEDIVHASAIISNQDGSVMQAAADRFMQVDVEHIRSIGAAVVQESMRRLREMLFAHTQEANQVHTALVGHSGMSFRYVRSNHPRIVAAAKPIVVATPATLVTLGDNQPMADVAIIDAGAHMPAVQLLSIVSRARQVVVLAHRRTVTCESLSSLIDILPAVTVRQRPVRRPAQLAKFLEVHGYGALREDPVVEESRGAVALHRIEANGVPVIATGLVESSQQEVDEVVATITRRSSAFTIVPTDYVLAVVSLTESFRTRLGAELKALAARSESVGRFLRHVRLAGIGEVAGLRADDVILALSYAKTSHGRLIHQFGALEGDGGDGMLMDALALSDHNVDIVAAFGSEDMDDDRLNQPGPKLLKDMLQWAEGLDSQDVCLQRGHDGDSVLFNDLADRIRARGLNAAVDYGCDHGTRIPLVVGLRDRPFALAVLTDDARFMSIQSTRERHRMFMQDLQTLGWSVMTVWSVGAFVNPDKEVERIVTQVSEMYRMAQ